MPDVVNFFRLLCAYCIYAWQIIECADANRMKIKQMNKQTIQIENVQLGSVLSMNMNIVKKEIIDRMYGCLSVCLHVNVYVYKHILVRGLMLIARCNHKNFSTLVRDEDFGEIVVPVQRIHAAFKHTVHTYIIAIFIT